MSASMYDIEGSRVDSALSLPLASNSHSLPHDIDLQPCCLAMPEFGPWSQINTRLEHDAAPVHQPEGSAHIHDDSSRPVLCSSHLKNGLATIDAALDLQLFETQAHADGTSPLCAHRPSPPAVATPSYQLPISGGESCLAAATIRCGHCRAEFTGTYRRGNLARHVRQKHTWRNKSAYPCTIDGCNKSFARSDARSKHAQKQHPGLCPEPVRRGHTQKASERIESYGINNDDNNISTSHHRSDRSMVADHVSYVGQWLPEASEAPGCEGDNTHQDCSLQLGLYQSTRINLCRLHAELGTANFMEFADAYFTRWESIVQYMRDTKSAAYPFYSRGLPELYAMVRNIISVGNIPIGATAQQYPEHQPHSSSLDVQLSSSASGSDPTNGTNTSRIFKRSENLKLNCPRFKWFKKHGGPRPCNGCQEMTVAKVRHHCNRTSHHRRPSFAKQCRTCQRDFVSAQAYQAHVSTRPACDPRPQARGDITAWVRLYLAHYPNAVRVVSPYDGNDDYLPDDEVARCRLPPASTDLESGTSSHSFLDQRRQHPSSRNNRVTPLTPIVHTSSPVAGQAAAAFMVQDAISLVNQGRSAQPFHNASPYDDDALRTIANFSQVLHSRPDMTHQQLRSLVDRTQAATRHLRGLVEMVEMAEAAISAYHTSEQHLQAEYRSRLPGDSTYQSLYQPQQYLHPADAGRTHGHQYPQTTSSISYDPVGMSTQPSSQGFDSASSAYGHSTETRPSSVQGLEDPILHSPFQSPYPYQRTPGSLGSSPYSPRQNLPYDQNPATEGYRQFVPEFNPNIPPSNIDPVLFEQPFEGLDSQNEDLGRRVWYSS